MTEAQASVTVTARSMAAMAAEAHVDTSDYLRSASEEEWNGPTGCTRWDLRALAGQILGEAVYVSVERGGAGTHNVTLHLTADQYVRLLYGRLPLRPAVDGNVVAVDGKVDQAEALNRLFAGVGGADT